MRFGLLTTLSVIAVFCSMIVPRVSSSQTTNASPNQYGAQQPSQQNSQQYQPAGIQSNSPTLGVVQPPSSAHRKPQTPHWWPLSGEHTQYIEKLLDHWQQSSDQVKQYKCDFMRWDYNPEFCNWRDPQDNKLAAMSVMSGNIRFATPDKARYDTTQVWDFDGPPEKPGDQPKYVAREKSENQERWICDGKAIYQFDYKYKRIYETDIPPEMQGKGLLDSPLPFFFGAKKEDLLNRYWVRIVTPQGVDNEFWLEAYPKRASDSQNYKKLVLVIARNDFLPQSLEIFAQNWDEKKNPVSRVFVFKNRKINTIGMGIQDWMGNFVRPQTPIGWDRVNRAQLQAERKNQPPAALQRPAELPNQNPTRKR